MKNAQDRNHSEKSDGTTIETSNNHESRETIGEETSEGNDEDLIISPKYKNLLLSQIVAKYGPRPSIGFKSKWSDSWKDNILKNENAGNKLLTSLARILTKSGLKGCACIKYEEKKIQVAFNGIKERYYDEEVSKVICQLATAIYNLEQRRQKIKTRVFTTECKENIASIKEGWKKLIKEAALKDKDFFSASKGSVDQIQTINKLLTDEEELKISFNNFEEAVTSFCHNCRGKKKLPMKILCFFWKNIQSTALPSKKLIQKN